MSRSDRRLPGIPGASKKKVIRITSRQVPVRNDCNKYATVLCSLENGVYVQVNEDKTIENIQWFKLSNGWICSMDNTGFLCYTITNEIEAGRSWAREYDNRKRISHAICNELTRSHSLPNARRVVRSIIQLITGEKKYPTKEDLLRKKDVGALNDAAADDDNDMKPNKALSLVNLPDVSIEDLIIALAASASLRQKELLGFMKIAAARQSNPVKALEDIAKEVEQLIAMRPTMWVTRGYNVLETYDIKSQNDQFIMAAANGNMNAFNKFLSKGQELIALHSELGYTALHAAADFGSLEPLKYLVAAGVNVNIKDTKKGQTCLHFAAMSGRSEIIKVLLDSGADRNLLNHNGLAAYEVANDQGHIEAREILKQVPTPIQVSSVSDATCTSISLTWDPPILDHKIYAKVVEYMVEWQPLGVATEVGHGNRFYVGNQLHFKMINLLPATGHSFFIYSKSLAGWSLPSSKITYFTLPDRPTPPPPVEIHKITTNGILFACLPPFRENGSSVIYYEVEVIDSKSLHDIENDSTTSSAANMSASAPTSSIDMMHRFIKIKRMDKKYKQCMGLQPRCPYMIRVRCKNEIGLSDYSEWNGPVTPQPGVYVLEKDGTRGMIRIGWFKSMLAPHRKITAYEVQCCNTNGPLSKAVTTGPKQAKSSVIVDEKEDTILMPFKTLRSDLRINELEVFNLKPGNKYLCRVRCQIDSVWNDWDMSLLSEIIDIPSAAPDAPFNVTAGISVEQDNRPAAPTPRSSLSTATDEAYDQFDNGSTGTNGATDTLESYEVDDEADGTTAAHISGVSKVKYELTHNSVVIVWRSGNSNGCPAIEYQIECAKVREYRFNDLALANGKNNSNSDDLIIRSINCDGVEIENITDSVIKQLQWSDVTSCSELLGPQAFRVHNLVPGSSYVFRVRQRNEIAWSPFSQVSPLITTYPSIPPGRPTVVSTGSYHSVIKWKESADDRLNLSNLDFAIEISSLPYLNSNELGADVNDDMQMTEKEWDDKVGAIATWHPAHCRKMDTLADDIDSLTLSDFDGNGSTGGMISGVSTALIDKLSTSTPYVARVKVRTVAGWSTYSAVSKVFTTLST